MSAWLDVIVMDNRPHSDAFHDQCIASVQAAIAQAGFDCRLVETDGNLQDIAKARIAGFDQTDAPYVTWVVDFDYLKPQAFSDLREALFQNPTPTAVFGREIRLEDGMRDILWPFRHHLAVYRRDIIQSVRGIYESKFIDLATRAAREAAKRTGPVFDVNSHCYVRRMSVP